MAQKLALQLHAVNLEPIPNRSIDFNFEMISLKLSCPLFLDFLDSLPTFQWFSQYSYLIHVKDSSGACTVKVSFLLTVALRIRSHYSLVLIDHLMVPFLSIFEF